MIELIKQLSGMHAVSGYEYRINSEIKSLLSSFCDEVKTDNLGNVTGVKRCGKPQAKKLLIEAHTDEVGLMVKNIDENGFITVAAVGGIDARILPALEVVVHAKRDIKGVVAAKPPHIMASGEEAKAVKLSDIVIDTGLSAEEAKKTVAVGDTVTFAIEAKELADGQLTGKSLDDRASIAVLVDLMKKLDGKRLNVDVYAVAAAQEEVGGYGAIAAAYSEEPDAAIAIDVCHGITPDNSYCAYEVGGGAVITCGPNIHPSVFEMLKRTAESNNIKYQIDADGGNTGTDAWQMQVVRDGIPTGLLSISLKYMHTPVETVSVADVVAVSDLIAGFITGLTGEEEWLCC